MIRTPRLVLRPWNDADVDSLAKHANSRAVWLNLRDRFPHPYTIADADRWIRLCASRGDPAARFAAADGDRADPIDLAIEYGGAAVGGIGIEPMHDVHRLSAELGYWLGESFWGKGLITEAVIAMTAHVFAHHEFERMQAAVFAWNPASARVLEKAGYRFEGRMARSIVKDGKNCDGLLYARLRGA